MENEGGYRGNGQVPGLARGEVKRAGAKRLLRPACGEKVAGRPDEGQSLLCSMTQRQASRATSCPGAVTLP